MKQASYRPSRMASLLLILAVHVVLLSCGGHATDVTSNCKLSVETPSERKVLSRLEPLTNRNFTVEKTDASKESYTYTLQICGDAGGVLGAGVIQVDNNKKKSTIVGLYNSTQAIGGSDWVMLIYKNGEKYGEHCNKELRKAIIMISCDRNANPGPLEVVLEDRDRQQDCFYLFEVDSSAVCPAVESHLGAGSILLIIGVCVIAVYLIGGFLYQRLVVGAKGMEQFPNYTFWAEVGNLSADGCDFVCRSRSREDAPAYRSAPSTEPLDEGPEERDDHLLPM